MDAIMAMAMAQDMVMIAGMDTEMAKVTDMAMVSRMAVAVGLVMAMA